MKTIFLTGYGYIGSRMIAQLSENYEVLVPGRYEEDGGFDLCDSKSVDKFFMNYQPDIVVHTAAAGARPENRFSDDVYKTNVQMFETLEKYIPELDKFINLDSGAIFDTTQSINGNSIYEESKIPSDEYGASKLKIAQAVLTYPNAVNLRLYGCFGTGGNPNRFFAKCMMNALNGLDIHIDNMYMDYFYVHDIPVVIDHCINNVTPQDIDLVYESSGLVTLNDLAREIYYLMPRKTGIISVNDDRMPFYYCGNPDNLKALNLKLNGLMNGIINTAADYIRKWML